jgi:hypothetical protein
MTQGEAIKVFEQRAIRSLWDGDAEKWFFVCFRVKSEVGGMSR